jgi:hypothetical protein
MSDFDYMTVALQTPVLRDVMITVPVKETTLQRFVRLFTGKAAPTAQQSVIREVDAFRELEFDGGHDAETVRDVLDKMTDNGWEVVSVVVSENYTSTELVTSSNGTPTGGEVGQLLVAMNEDPYYAAGFVAAIHENGFGFASDLNEWMQDHYQGEYASAADYAENFFNDVHSHDVTGMPDWVSVDWEDSADNLKYDVEFIEHPESGMTHVFWRH